MKDTFYFPHDYNAHEDEKILRLMSVLGWEGYGLYWGIIEKLASSSDGRLKISDLEFIAFGMRTQCERINDLVHTYGLFEIENGLFWSNRLIRHFQERELKSDKARQSAKTRWASKATKNANASKIDAIKERKGKKRICTIFSKSQNVALTTEEYRKLSQKYGGRLIDRTIEDVEMWKLKIGNCKWVNDYAGIFGWLKKPIAKGELKISFNDFRESDFDNKTDYEAILNKYPL